MIARFDLASKKKKISTKLRCDGYIKFPFNLSYIFVYIVLKFYLTMVGHLLWHVILSFSKLSFSLYTIIKYEKFNWMGKVAGNYSSIEQYNDFYKSRGKSYWSKILLISVLLIFPNIAYTVLYIYLHWLAFLFRQIPLFWSLIY